MWHAIIKNVLIQIDISFSTPHCNSSPLFLTSTNRNLTNSSNMQDPLTALIEALIYIY